MHVGGKGRLLWLSIEPHPGRTNELVRETISHFRRPWTEGQGIEIWVGGLHELPNRDILIGVNCERAMLDHAGRKIAHYRSGDAMQVP